MSMRSTRSRRTGSGDMDFLTIAETARRLSVSASTVRRLLVAGVLPSVLVSPRCRRIPAGALTRYAQECVWQSDRKTDGGLSSFAKAEREYSAACTQPQPARTRRRSKPSSAAIYSLPNASGSRRNQA